MLKRLERFNKGIEILNELKILSIAERNLQVCTDFLIDQKAEIIYENL